MARSAIVFTKTPFMDSGVSSSLQPIPPPPESTLVYGHDETGISALAAGLALRLHPWFRWVDCARSGPVDDVPVHWIFARGSARPQLDRVDGTSLRTPTWTTTSLSELVASEGPDEDLRLASFLALPELFQRIGAPDPPSEREVVILLANIDALPSKPGGLRLEDRNLHVRLHEAGIALFATAKLPTPAGVLDSFDKVYRVDVPEGTSWSHGVVTDEKEGPADQQGPGRLTVREIWRQLELDPTLLPPF